jgi:hypothetical protein
VLTLSSWLGTIIARHPINHEDGKWGLPSLMLEDGWPTLYQEFVSDVRRQGYADVVIPMPLDLSEGLALLKELQIRVGLAWVDLDSGFPESYRLLSAVLPLLEVEHGKPGPCLVNNFDEAWDGLKSAVAAVCVDANRVLLVAEPYAALISPNDKELLAGLLARGWRRTLG